MAITATMVKELRDKTGAGMMECKKALGETEGNMDKAVTWLREKGIASASKKAGRATGEGLIGMKAAADGRSVALAEVNCETDFVAKTEDFLALVAACADKAMQVAGTDPAEGGRAVSAEMDEAVKATIGKLGENMGVGQAATLKLEGEGGIGTYHHPDGKLAVAVEIRCKNAASAARPEFAALLKDMAMQVAGHIPAAMAVDRSQISQSFIDNERQIALAQARETGKPDNLLEKIAEGKVNKVLQEVTLMDQVFIKDGKARVREVLQAAAKALGDEPTVGRFVRLKVGEAA